MTFNCNFHMLLHSRLWATIKTKISLKRELSILYWFGTRWLVDELGCLIGLFCQYKDSKNGSNYEKFSWYVLAHKKWNFRRIDHKQGLQSKLQKVWPAYEVKSRLMKQNQCPWNQIKGQNSLLTSKDQTKCSKAQGRVTQIMLKHFQAQKTKIKSIQDHMRP